MEPEISAGFLNRSRVDQSNADADDRNSVSILLDSDKHAQNTGKSRQDDKADSTTSEVALDNNEWIPGHDYFGSGEDILRWPIFEDKYDRCIIEALIFDPTLPCENLRGPATVRRVLDESTQDESVDPRQKSGSGPGVREEDVPHLVETFLLNVHVKNPIFDPEYLRKMARNVVENGFDWKASSCLLVCSISFCAFQG